MVDVTKYGPDHHPPETESGPGRSAGMGNYYLPRGVLTVNVIDITELKGRTELLGRYDPFVKVTVGEQTVFTSVQRNAGSMPEWNEAFKFPLKSERNFINPIGLEVYDRNIMTSDYLMGKVSLDLADIPECQTGTFWKIPVSKNVCLESEAALGQIRFSIDFQARTAADMLEMNMPEQNHERPRRSGVVKKVRAVATASLGVVSSVVGIATFYQNNND